MMLIKKGVYDMKKMKKFTSFILTLIMAFSMSSITFAAETYSITINNSIKGHIYEAYQIFTGDLHEGVLSNIKWGSSITNSHDLGSAATVAEKMDTNYTGEDKITLDDLLEMITLGDSVANSDKTSNSYVISGLRPGYYLVKDKDDSLTGENDSYTEYIIKVVGDVETNPKSDVPEVEKKIKDTNDSEDSSIDDNPWQDSADHDIGDKVPFQLKATLADNVSSYTTYKIVFHDTLSKGLTYNNDAKIYIDGKETKGFTFNATVNADKTTTLTVSCDDVKALGATNNSIITVEYTATLNENANLG
ncbi:MAG: isopeptide-forming domain-containing fimbrial protein, partial [Clostridiaceae bacterium]